ncbi:MAG: hypothetical protein ACAI34_22395 [Verrucomicrobium sp.]
MNKSLFLIGTMVAAVTNLLGQAPSTVPSKLAGFHKVTARAWSTTLVGVNFVRPVLASGKLDAEAANSLTDNNVDFNVALAGQTNLWVEITSGTNKGIASPVTTIAQRVLTTEDDLSGFSAPGDTYEVRAAHTIATLFGAANSAGLKPCPTAAWNGSADLVYVSDGAGGYKYVFYSTAAAGWREVNSGTADAAGTPVYHVDGLWITRNDFTNLNITFAGVLRSTPTFFPVANGSNLPFNTVYPTGSTLANSGLDTQVLKGDETTADIVWIPNAATGGWDQYYYANALPPNITAGWKQVGQGNTDKGATAFPSAFSFERRGTTANVKMIPNTVYNGL